MTRQDLVDYTAETMEKFLLNQGTLEQIVTSYTNLDSSEQGLICFILGAAIAQMPYGNLKPSREVYKPWIAKTIDEMSKEGVLRLRG